MNFALKTTGALPVPILCNVPRFCFRFVIIETSSSSAVMSSSSQPSDDEECQRFGLAGDPSSQNRLSSANSNHEHPVPRDGYAWVYDPLSKICYRYFPKRYDFFQCGALCERFGGSIATQKTAAISSFMHRRVLPREPRSDHPDAGWSQLNEYWIGLYRDPDFESEWSWVADSRDRHLGTVDYNGTAKVTLPAEDAYAPRLSKPRLNATDWAQWASGHPIGRTRRVCVTGTIGETHEWFSTPCNGPTVLGGSRAEFEMIDMPCTCQSPSAPHPRLALDMAELERWPGPDMVLLGVPLDTLFDVLTAVDACCLSFLGVLLGVGCFRALRVLGGAGSRGGRGSVRTASAQGGRAADPCSASQMQPAVVGAAATHGGGKSAQPHGALPRLSVDLDSGDFGSDVQSGSRLPAALYELFMVFPFCLTVSVNPDSESTNRSRVSTVSFGPQRAQVVPVEAKFSSATRNQVTSSQYERSALDRFARTVYRTLFSFAVLGEARVVAFDSHFARPITAAFVLAMLVLFLQSHYFLCKALVDTRHLAALTKLERAAGAWRTKLAFSFAGVAGGTAVFTAFLFAFARNGIIRGQMLAIVAAVVFACILTGVWCLVLVLDSHEFQVRQLRSTLLTFLENEQEEDEKCKGVEARKHSVSSNRSEEPPGAPRQESKSHATVKGNADGTEFTAQELQLALQPVARHAADMSETKRLAGPLVSWMLGGVLLTAACMAIWSLTAPLRGTREMFGMVALVLFAVDLKLMQVVARVGDQYERLAVSLQVTRLYSVDAGGLNLDFAAASSSSGSRASFGGGFAGLSSAASMPEDVVGDGGHAARLPRKVGLLNSLVRYFDDARVAKRHCWCILGAPLTSDVVKRVTAVGSAMLASGVAARLAVNDL